MNCKYYFLARHVGAPTVSTSVTLLSNNASTLACPDLTHLQVRVDLDAGRYESRA